MKSSKKSNRSAKHHRKKKSSKRDHSRAISKHSRKKHHSHKETRSRSHKKHSSSSSSGSSDLDVKHLPSSFRSSGANISDVKQSTSSVIELDKNEEICDLQSYINERSVLVRHVFASITRADLRKLLPGSLKNLEIKTLMTMCVDELEGMSNKRILAIIEGSDLLESSADEQDSGGLQESNNFAQSAHKGHHAEIAVADSTTSESFKKEGLPTNQTSCGES